MKSSVGTCKALTVESASVTVTNHIYVAQLALTNEVK